MESDMNTESWEPNDLMAEDIHRELRDTEFFGFCLGAIREDHRLFPDFRIGAHLMATYSNLLILGLSESLKDYERPCTVWDYLEEFGANATGRVILSAMAEVEREHRS